MHKDTLFVLEKLKASNSFFTRTKTVDSSVLNNTFDWLQKSSQELENRYISTGRFKFL